MSCIRIQACLSNIGKTCLNTLGLKRKPRRLEISAPFNFKEGPAVNFPGYSEDDISLMREKAIASTAIVEDGEFDLASRRQRARSRTSSLSCGLGGSVVHHVKRLSRSYAY